VSTGLAARRAALVALRAVDEDEAYSTLAVPAAIDSLGTARDRAFASHLAYDTLRWQGTLDWALTHVLSRPLPGVEPGLRRVLRLGALQLLRTSIPPRAVVDTSVRLARESVPHRRAGGAGGFVNGVLRGLARRADELPWPDPRTEPVAHLALDTGHPGWIVQELLERFAEAETRRILEADNAPPGLTLRATGDREVLVEELLADGIDATPGTLAPEAVRAPGGDPRRLPAVATGRAVPQDEASMVVAHWTGAAPGQRVVDLCAGPGGKATHLAHLTGADGRVVANDLHPHRAALIAGAARRQGLDVAVTVGDATRPPFADGVADVVLVDAPCSGLGTGRRRPEVRWRKRPADVTALAVLQRDILRGAAPLVRSGGVLVYAACTWTHAETDAVVEVFLEDAASDFAGEDRRQLWPHRDGTDGMYICRMRRAV
jgi:16S rRNA (cytosine967-C5)-methyltransferase